MIFYMIFMTYPSEKYEWTSVGMMKFPIFGKSFKIPWFQSPPARFCHDKSTRLISEKWKIGKVVLQVTASRASWSSPWRCLWRSEGANGARWDSPLSRRPRPFFARSHRDVQLWRLKMAADDGIRRGLRGFLYPF